MNINTLSIYNSTYDDNNCETFPEVNEKCFPKYYPYNECIYDTFIILAKCICILGCFVGIIIIIIVFT
jgi:hypothetical protein